MGKLVGNLYSHGLRRILVTKDNTFSHIVTKEWGPNMSTTTLTRAKGELNVMRLICNVNSKD